MLKGIDLSQRIEFSCKDDEEPKTVFVIKPLSGIEMLDVVNNMSGMISVSIVEIKNPDMSDKDKIDDFIRSLPAASLTELVIKITEINNLTGEEVKN